MKYIVTVMIGLLFSLSAIAENSNKIMVILPEDVRVAPEQGLTAIKFMPGLYVGTADLTRLQGNISPVPSSHEELDVSTASILLKTPDNATSPISNWWRAGYTGKKAVIGVLDSGVPDNHMSFTRQSGLAKINMKVNRTENSGFDRYLNGVRTPHGTGVACIYANEQPDRHGVAFGARNMLVTLAGDSEVDDTDWELTLYNLDWLLTTPGQIKPTTINYSFGNGDVTEDWSMVAQTVDYIVNHYNISWVKSAGNTGPSPYTLSVPADSYNAIVVANMNNTVEKTTTTLLKMSDRSQHRIQPSSSRGPTLDGRRKPDITAPGNDTRTCAPNPSVYAVADNPTFKPYSTAMQYDATSETRLAGGTSMATPHVGGATALVYDSGILDPMAIKALLINSADAWSDEGAVSGSAWNSTYGWGYLNMDKAFKQRHFVKNNSIKPGKKICYAATLNPNEKISLVWERRFDRTLTPMELTLYAEDGKALLSADRSRIDNVLQVSYPGSQQNKVEILVKIPDDVTKTDGALSEPFALASEQKLTNIHCRAH